MEADSGIADDGLAPVEEDPPDVVCAGLGVVEVSAAAPPGGVELFEAAAFSGTPEAELPEVAGGAAAPLVASVFKTSFCWFGACGAFCGTFCAASEGAASAEGVSFLLFEVSQSNPPWRKRR